MNKLEKLLFRKSSLEKRMDIWAKGIKTYTEYIDSCKEVVKDEEREEWEKIEAKVNLHNAEIPLHHYITSWKMAKMELEEYILREIEKEVSEEEKENIEFKDLQKEMEELATNEIFANHSKRPDNIELIDVNNDISRHIQLLKIVVEKGTIKSRETEDFYEQAKLNLEVFKANLQLVSNHKRLKEREDYYYNVFKPKFDKDMEEANKYLEPMLERASEIVKLGIDIKLGFMLQEYEKNKQHREKTWLFYTALKSRLKKIGKEMRKNKGQFKGKMHLAKDII